MTIYRKYRSQNFNEIVGQEHVVQILKQAVLESRLAHAYLFTGPRGTGKTSMARILSKALNCLNQKDGEPCNKCSNCLAINSGRFMDLIEIDAASNRGIDEIRGLKEGISFLPVEGKYKIYIIDEVHMLTEPAFNALLKTLEEPPAQVLFILATTEPQKLPLTIISRTQRFDFKLADDNNLNIKLSRILKSEGVGMAPDALDVVIKAGQGSFRDAETVLEKVLSVVSVSAAVSKDLVTKDEVESILGYVSSTSIKKFVTALIKDERNEAFKIVHEAMDEGSNMSQFLKETLEQTRLMMIDSVNTKKNDLRKILQIIKELNQASIELKTSLINVLPIELAIINITANAADVVKSNNGIVPVQAQLKTKPISDTAPKEKVINEGTSEVKDQSVAIVNNDVLEDAQAEEILVNIKTNRDAILQESKKYNHFLTAILSGSEFAINPGKGLVLKVSSAFYKKQLDGAETRKQLNKILATITGINFYFECIIDKTFKAQKTKSSNAKLVEELLS